MRESTLNAVDTIDAALFTGDEFLDKEARAYLTTYIERWQRWLASQQAVMCECCKGSGRVTRDADIGTDQECFVCSGYGFCKEE